MSLDKLVDSTQLDADLTIVANAIRTKGGTSAQLAFPTDFVTAIGAIPSGGGGGAAPEKDVNFIDYDGTILYSYTAAEAQELTELPANPDHSGDEIPLTSQGWNWTLAQIKAQLTAVPGGPVWVGQMYVTADGKSAIVIKLYGPRLSPYLGIAVNGTVDIDWGDGSTHSTVTGTSLTTQIRTQHTYPASGEYTIIISVTSGKFSFYGTSTYYILNNNNSTAMANAVYSTCVKRVRIGNNANIGDYAFYMCQSIDSITIPSYISAIGTYAVSYIYEAKSFVIPSLVTAIKDYFAKSAYGVLYMSLPPELTSIATYGFESCTTMKSLTIPSSVTSIGTYAFRYATVLHKLYLPEGITTLNKTECFEYARAIVEFIIPSTVTAIGSYAFRGCFGIKEYHFKRTTPPTLSSTNAFTDTATNSIFYVPYSADHSILNAYKTASNWSTYASRMQEEPA